MPAGQWPDDDGWEVHETHPLCKIFKRPLDSHSYYDVAIAASITGAARAILMGAIFSCGDVMYCDTDSIICGGDFPLKTSETELGAWKHEATLSTLAIAGKKLYAGRGVDPKGNPIVKIASKGIKATPDQIEAMADGAIIEWRSDAPNFKMDGATKFVARKARMKKV